MPGASQSADLSNRNHAQKAKHPAISASAAQRYTSGAMAVRSLAAKPTAGNGADAVHRLLRLTIRGPLAQAGGTTPPLCTASARARAEVDGVDAVQGENSRKAGREAATTLRADASGLPGRPGRAGESGQPELASTAWQARLCQASHSASAA